MYNNLPEWLIKPPIFCTHKDKKPTHGTKPGQLDTFFSFEDALKNLEDDSEQRLGIGIFGALCGIDIDKCIDEDGNMAQTAKDIINMFPEAYIEYSFSGNGLHLLFLSKEQHKDEDTYYCKPSQKYLKSIGITDVKGIEFYQGMTDHRYFTVTGKVFKQQETQQAVEGDVILSFLEKYMKRPPMAAVPVEVTELDSSDDEDKAWARFGYKTDEAFRNFYDTTLAPSGTKSGEDESAMDLGFLCILAKWCNRNPKVMEYIFEKSPYFLSKDGKHLNKWNGVSHKTYKAQTIKKAIEACTEVAKLEYVWFKYNSDTNKIEGGDTVKVYPVEGKDNRFTYKDEHQIRYTAQMKISKQGNLYCDWIKSYNCETKEDLGFIDRNIKQDDDTYKSNPEFYRIQETFKKNIND